MQEIIDDTAPLDDELMRAGYVMQVCALRFNGYGWAESVGGKGDTKILSRLTDEFVDALTLFPETEKNFAVFLFMQRTFRHWGLGFLSYPDDAMSRAAVFLFVELKEKQPPGPWADPEMCGKWAGYPGAEIEQAASAARRWLLAAASGKALQPPAQFVRLESTRKSRPPSRKPRGT